jgi:hypothetical protein
MIHTLDTNLVNEKLNLNLKLFERFSLKKSRHISKNAFYDRDLYKFMKPLH